MGILKQRGIEDTVWKVGLILLLSLISLPVLSILFQTNTEFFSSLFSALTEEYTLNTIFLMIGTGLLTVVIGVFTAWVVSTYHFPYSSFFSWALVLPLAFPAYILAYTYKGIFGLFGTLHAMTGSYFEIDNIWGLLVVLSVSLYPYVYITSRVSFSLSSKQYLLSAASLGSGEMRTFFKVALPLSWPAIFGGLLLVLMEVLNNYGAVHYFGVSTFTTEIIRVWNPMDGSSIHNIAAILIVFILLFLFLERRIRKGASFEEKTSNFTDTPLLTSNRPYVITMLCAIPLFIGFIFPLVQLLFWSMKDWRVLFESEMLEIITTTFSIGFGSALIAAIIAFTVKYYMQNGSGSKVISVLNQMAKLGYTVPGALLGVGLLSVIFYINKYISFSLTSSLSILILAYVVRFYSVSMSSIHGGFEKIPQNMALASFSLGKGLGRTMTTVHSKLLRNAFIASVVLVFVDVIKELPLTMMFQRFNFQTLAVKAFKLMETDGAIYDAALPSLIIVLISVIPVYLMDRWMK